MAAYKYVYLPSKVNLSVKNNELINNATSSTTTTEINSNQNTYIIATSTATSSQDINSNKVYQNVNEVEEDFKNTTITCNNYDCAIQAASICKPVLSLVDIKIPYPINQDITISSKIKTYFGKLSSGKCVQISSPVGETKAIVSTAGRNNMIKDGATNQEIDSMLSDINNVYKENKDDSITTCISDENALAQYFIDLKDGNLNISEDSNGSSTYTTSKGQKISCNIQ